MLRYFLVLLSLFMFGCTGTDDPSAHGEGDDTSTGSPEEPEKPVALTKVVSVSLSAVDACAVDEQHHVACWRHPKNFVPSSPGSTRGHYEMAYPKKDNSELAGQRFTALSASEEVVCAVNTESKVICFIPNDPSEKKPTDLAAMGQFSSVVLGGNGYFCALDQSGSLSCHQINFEGVPLVLGKNILDDFTSPDEITSLSLGQVKIGPKTYTRGVCWTTSAKLLACAEVADWDMPPPAKQEAVAFGSSSSLFGTSFATISPDKKSMKLFSSKRKLTITDVDEFKFDKRYSDIALSVSTACGILKSTNKISCQQQRSPDAPKKSNEDLRNELLIKVSVGYVFICGLRTDHTAFCWQGQDYQPGIPKNIQGE